MLILPTINEIPGPMVNDAGVIVLGGYPAVDLYEFRLHTFTTQLIIWTTIGLVFAALISKVLDGRRNELNANVTA